MGWLTHELTHELRVMQQVSPKKLPDATLVKLDRTGHTFHWSQVPNLTHL